MARANDMAWDGKYSTYGLMRAVCKVFRRATKTGLSKRDAMTEVGLQYSTCF